ncbi:unnamed protein product [Cuscuta epithymum]|uniref:Methyltransferase type 11 domain-containing protein n=1 Tax=Cuscuta epithymum TaxID=186058 RepID=A0AAV0DN56_9ASTE|nr:unnamed protein product [Cuscuta epithymum]
MSIPNMGKQFGLRLQSQIPSWVGLRPSIPLPATTAISVCPSARRTSPPLVIRRRRGRCFGFKTSRRAVVFGTGVFMSANFGGKSFLAASSSHKKGAIQEVLKNVSWPEQFPFKEDDFQRFDESKDSLFYEMPRLVTHIDDPAIAALTRYYSQALPHTNSPGVAILDMCSSWVSHYPAGYKQTSIIGLGMNAEELRRNPVLTDYVVQDLNINPKLPFEDNTFDAITNMVSVDYLTKPIVVFKEMSRVLKPGGVAIISFSNRCFWTKAISIWTSTGDDDHVMIVGSYFHYAGGFEPPEAVDISPNPGRSDPMYVVYSRKQTTQKGGQ